MTHRESEALFIKSRREALGLTQACLAKLVGKTNKQYIANIESGRNGVPIWMIRQFAKALKVDVRTLVSFRLRAYEEELTEAVLRVRRKK